MFNLTIQPQPVSLQFDMSQVESYDETTMELKLFNIEQKQVKEDVDGVEFVTKKSYDKKYVFDVAEIADTAVEGANFVADLKQLISGTLTDITISGTVLSNTDTTLKGYIETYNSTPVRAA